jgi:hypothetical protein
MNESKKYELQDLIEKIDQVDKIITIHAGNPSKFMLEQYMAKKEKLLSYLIDELVDQKVRSAYSFKLISLALNKFYPDIAKKNNRQLSKVKNYKELKELEAVLA